MNENRDKADLALDLLENFNRKERYHLLCDAVVGSPFALQDPFLEKINEQLDWPIPRKGHVYVAMDYHLDWIASALHLVERPEPDAAQQIIDGRERIDVALPEESAHNRIGPDSDVEIITGNPADADLLVAYKSGRQLVLVLIEAKLESGWDGTQLGYKGSRLKHVFENGRYADWVIPRFVIAGPKAHESAPNFSPDTLNECPDWFFNPPTGEGDRSNEQLRRINLTAKHALYQPARLTKDGHFWHIKKTWPKKNGSKE